MKEESVSKVSSELASEYFRQRNSLTKYDLSKEEPAEIQLSLAFRSFSSESASRELKLSFPYQKSRTAPLIRESASIFPRESKIVRILLHQNRNQAAERELSRRTASKPASKTKAAPAQESPRQRNPPHCDPLLQAAPHRSRSRQAASPEQAHLHSPTRNAHPNLQPGLHRASPQQKHLSKDTSSVLHNQKARIWFSTNNEVKLPSDQIEQYWPHDRELKIKQTVAAQLAKTASKNEQLHRVAPQLLEFTYSSQCTRAPWSMESGGFASISQAGETIHTCRGDSHLEAVSHNMPKGGFSQLLCQTRLQTSALIKMFLSYQSRLLAVRGPQQDKTNLSRDGLNPAHVPLHG
ncbi:Conserved_hypothetical protein [Hexamita inflata]|uniref:Uncharacterized protein n=1 Tax=Hexamita inflata TaxID=28002 RepID=A0AA86RF48_9EUKA|nr:Conserved hypothetical protein [Hexamita inflata]